MPDQKSDVALRLDKTVFGNSVRKLLENSEFEENPTQKEIPKIIELRGFKIGSGEGI